MNVGSLFSGIGGIEFGLERAGNYHTRWFVEYSQFCREILRKRFPDAKIYTDITTIDFDEVEPVDVLTGGFPCQDISSLGKRIGITGKKSGLWKHYLRAIRSLRPEFVIVENVPALINRGIGTVLGDLSEAGYDAEWLDLRCSDLGGQHKRERIFIIAYPCRLRDDESVEDIRIFGRWLEDEKKRVSHFHPIKLLAREKLHPEWWQKGQDPDPKPCTLRGFDGISRRMDRLHSLGNAVSPICAELIGRIINRQMKHEEESMFLNA